jgi:hypothetical protein
MPLPGTRVIPEGWSAYHRPSATLALTSTCRITRGNGTGGSDAHGTWSPAAQVQVYEGPCRIVPANVRTEAVATQGERRITRHRYDVDVAFDCPDLETGDTIEVLTSQDPGMPGKRLRIVDLLVASEQWTRHMTATEFERGR